MISQTWQWLNHITARKSHHCTTWAFAEIFFRGETSKFCLSFLGCWRCNANGRSQNALTFLHHKENAPCYGNSNKKALRWQCCRPQGLGLNIQMRKTVLFKDRIFSCFVVGFILRSFLFTQIEIVILMTKKEFLHRALLFLLWVTKLYFWCNEYANELHNAISARPSGLAKCHHQSELPVLITSHLKNQIDAKIKGTAIPKPTNCRVPYRSERFHKSIC